MLVAALLSPATAEVLETVRPLGEVVWFSVRPRDAAATQADFEAAVRTAADVLLLDAGAGPPEALVAGARRYRVSRPDSRVVLLAPGRLPGDAVVADLVSLGIYDILAPQDDNTWGPLLQATLAGPPATYAEAARWAASTAPAPPSRTAARGTRVADRPLINARPITVAVGAVAQGVGSTHMALTLTSFLARQGYRVALVEACSLPALARLLLKQDMDPGLDPHGAEIMPGVVLYTLPVTSVGRPEDPRNQGASRLADALGRRPQHQYVVIDLGTVQPDHPELLRADLALIAASPAPWRLHETLEWAGRAGAPHLRLVFTPASQVPDALHAGRLRADALPWLPPDLLPGYQHEAPEVDAALARILDPVMLRPARPTGQARAHLFRWMLRRARRRFGPALLPASLAVVAAYLVAAWAYLAWIRPEEILHPTPLVAPGAALLRAFKFLLQSTAS